MTNIDLWLLLLRWLSEEKTRGLPSCPSSWFKVVTGVLQCHVMQRATWKVFDEKQLKINLSGF